MSMDPICMLWRHGLYCMDMVEVFLWEKTIWLWKMPSGWRRIYGYGICLVVGEEYIDSHDVFWLEKGIWIWNMSPCWRRVYGYGSYLS